MIFLKKLILFLFLFCYLVSWFFKHFFIVIVFGFVFIYNKEDEQTNTTENKMPEYIFR